MDDKGIVGYLDDGDSYADLKQLLEEYINLLPIENCNSLEDILSWILKNQVQCLIVDHKLLNKYEFYGTDVVTFINKNIPDLPCIVLTSFKNDSINENLVIDCLIRDRRELIGEDSRADLGESLKQSCNVFVNRLKKREEEYEFLYNKKNQGTITSQEEEDLKQVYILLRNYGSIDEVPAELFTSEMTKKVTTLIEKLDNYISCEDKNNG